MGDYIGRHQIIPTINIFKKWTTFPSKADLITNSDGEAEWKGNGMLTNNGKISVKNLKDSPIK